MSVYASAHPALPTCDQSGCEDTVGWGWWLARSGTDGLRLCFAGRRVPKRGLREWGVGIGPTLRSRLPLPACLGAQHPRRGAFLPVTHLRLYCLARNRRAGGGGTPGSEVA